MKEEKSTRHFSDAFKKDQVKMIDKKVMAVVQLSRIYDVTGTAIYKWIHQWK